MNGCLKLVSHHNSQRGKSLNSEDWQNENYLNDSHSVQETLLSK